MTIYLLDKSAVAQRHGQTARARLEGLVAQGRIAVCHITAMELLYSARNAQDYVRMRSQLDAYRWLDTSLACLDRALEVQGLLAARGAHRLPLPDLLIAATAELHGHTVLHHDHDFETIATVTDQPVEFLITSG